jgi:membrane protein YdbS with pleckstrin-like domain
MFENINIDFESWVKIILGFLFKIAKIPFTYWNGLPPWIRWIVYVLILLFAIFMGWVTWKFKDEWRYRN